MGNTMDVAGGVPEDEDDMSSRHDISSRVLFNQSYLSQKVGQMIMFVKPTSTTGRHLRVT